MVTTTDPALQTSPKTRAPAPSLRCPEAEDAWRVAPVAHAPAAPEARLGGGEHLLVEPQSSGLRTMVYGMVAAVCVVAAVLAGMAALSYGNGPAQTQSASAPAR